MDTAHTKYEMQVNRRTQEAANMGKDSDSLRKKTKILTEWNSVGHGSRSRVIIYEMLQGI